MPFNIRNILIFVGLAVVFTSIYIFFIKGPSEDSNLVSSSGEVTQVAPGVASSGSANPIAQNFLSLLLNIKNIRLNDEIFSDPAFKSLRDSSIVLTPDGNPGRINPFAQLGSDPTPVIPPSSTAPTSPSTPTSSGGTTTPTPPTGAGMPQ